MCLAVPGKILSIRTGDAQMQLGKVSFGGIVKDVCLACVPDAAVGDYVLVHVGFAIGKVNEKEAQRVFSYLKEMDELRELEEHSP